MIHGLPIPTPFAVGRVNCYLVDDDPLTLIDTGPNSGKALDELEHQLAALGHQIADLELVILTHQHIDHLGLVEIVAERSGADVAAIDAVVRFVAHFAEDAEADDRFAAELVLTGHGDPIEDHRALIDERFRLHARRARKIHGLVAERPRTAYEIAQALWGDVAVTQAYLTLSEVLGHVDLLLADGRAHEIDDGDVVRFAANGG